MKTLIYNAEKHYIGYFSAWTSGEVLNSYVVKTNKKQPNGDSYYAIKVRTTEPANFIDRFIRNKLETVSTHQIRYVTYNTLTFKRLGNYIYFRTQDEAIEVCVNYNRLQGLS